MPKLSQIVADIKQAIDAKDEGQIAFIASEYSADARQRVAQGYKDQYNKELPDDIKKALKGGPEESLLMDLFSDRHEVRAQHIRDALSGRNDHMAFFDTVILCTPEDWHETAAAYTRMFKKPLVEDFMKDVGRKENWCLFMEKWMAHERTSREGSPEEEAEKLNKAFNESDHDYISSFMAGVPPEEYKPINTSFKAIAGKGIDQAFAVLYTGPDYYSLYCAHFALLGMHKLAAYLINCACNDKGDEKRMRRITGLMVDKCLAAKYAYKTYGSMKADVERAFDKRMAPILCTLWRLRE